MVSILILTLNEEINLAECIDSISFSDDIVVLDSFSSDKTVSIAEENGAKVVQRKFDNWAGHQNWAMENIKFKYEWVFYLDADERMTKELEAELIKVVNTEKEKVAFYCGRKNYFLGKWLKHSMPPGFVMRFFKPNYIRFERLVNPVPVIEGKYGYLKNMFLHYNFSKGIKEWFDKHNNYSTLEAMEGMKIIKNKINLINVFSSDRAVRRQTIKNISFKLPFRPFIKFIYMYVFRLGFLDGKPGYIYCMLQSIYEYQIVLKMIELKRKLKELPI